MSTASHADVELPTGQHHASVSPPHLPGLQVIQRLLDVAKDHVGFSTLAACCAPMPAGLGGIIGVGPHQRLLDTWRETNRAGLSVAMAIGLPRNTPADLVSRLVVLGLPPGMSTLPPFWMTDPTAAAVPPKPPRQPHCPGCTCPMNEDR